MYLQAIHQKLQQQFSVLVALQLSVCVGQHNLLWVASDDLADVSGQIPNFHLHNESPAMRIVVHLLCSRRHHLRRRFNVP